MECQRSLAIAAKVLLAALFCCPGAGSLRFVVTTHRLGATPPWDGQTLLNPSYLVELLPEPALAAPPRLTGGECYNRRPFRAPQPNPVIFTLGINHHTAPLAVREQVAFDADTAAGAG